MCRLYLDFFDKGSRVMEFMGRKSKNKIIYLQSSFITDILVYKWYQSQTRLLSQLISHFFSLFSKFLFLRSLYPVRVLDPLLC